MRNRTVILPPKRSTVFLTNARPVPLPSSRSRCLIAFPRSLRNTSSRGAAAETRVGRSSGNSIHSARREIPASDERRSWEATWANPSSSSLLRSRRTLRSARAAVRSSTRRSRVPVSAASAVLAHDLLARGQADQVGDRRSEVGGQRSRVGGRRPPSNFWGNYSGPSGRDLSQRLRGTEELKKEGPCAKRARNDC